MNAPDVSIVIVHYETPDLLRRCLAAIGQQQQSPSFEIVVVDNNSRGFEATEWPGITVIANKSNDGFARAANQGIQQTKGRYLLLLNPDAFLAPDTLAAMTVYMDAHPDVGCATAKLVLENGRLDLACRRSFPTPKRAFYRLTWLSKLFPRSRRFGQYNLTYLDENQETEIDAPCGAFMFVRRAVIDQIGLLDERYFMYGEDLDWAFRMKQAGWRVTYTPITTVTHIKRASSRRSRRRTIRAFYDAMRIFHQDHYAAGVPGWLSWLIYRTIDARQALELTANAVASRLPRRA